MTKRGWQEAGFIAIALLTAAVMFLSLFNSKLRWSAIMFPTVVAGVLAAVGLLALLRYLIRGRAEGPSDGSPAEIEALAFSLAAELATGLVVAGASLAYLAGVLWIGLGVSTTVALIIGWALFPRMGAMPNARDLTIDIAISAVLGAGLYLLFVRAAGVYLPNTLLF